ncbi:hypothetical protein CH352_14445 [Leptospira hartskeerlii]|uniref:hypothetical protein n=1 Tax=Leptospira hartskeerlii TaxID=2023177 RepID=UPI000CB07F2A|nr:hypothetical protein [Leptospira hartskeerlii]PJZ32991.1 hypothetical protein CH352_14445 [Leptospira hartskeerlii]
MSLPNPSPNTNFDRNTHNDGLLFGAEFERLYANDNALQAQVTDLQNELLPTSFITNTPNWSNPPTNTAPSVKAAYLKAKRVLNTFSGWILDFWTSRTSPVTSAWSSVCWSPSLGMFVAVSDGAADTYRSMSSMNGINWGANSCPDNQWTSVCWSPSLSLFVAIAKSGTGNRVMTSSNGTNWTSRTSAADNQWTSVCWSSELNLFVAVASSGTGNRVMTSSNGIDWVARTSAADNNWSSVCWSPQLGLFAAVGTLMDIGVMTSPDGIVWTSRYVAGDHWRSICWSNELGIFLAVGYGVGVFQILVSSDGINWQSNGVMNGGYWTSISWSSELNLFVALATGGFMGNGIMTSSDGVNWCLRKIQVFFGTALCWSPELGIFVAVANDSGIMTTRNGIGK